MVTAAQVNYGDIGMLGLLIPHICRYWFGSDFRNVLLGSAGLGEQVTDLRLTLSPRETRSFGFSASFPHIGNYRAGIRRIELLDALGIFRAVRDQEKSFGVEVLPRMAQIASLPVTANVQAESTHMSVQSPLNGSDYTGVREYAFGDPMKSIHWKLSAHAGGLMTKQMESYSNTGMSVILDLQIPASDASARLLRENCQGVYSQANLVVCTCLLTQELADLLVRLKQGGRTPILFLILSQTLDESTRQDRMAQLRRLAGADLACAKELEG
jgi:hypothetical protein